MKESTKATLKFITGSFLPLILVLMVLFSFVMSFVNYNKCISNEEQIITIQSQISKQNEMLINRLDAIDSHLEFLDKWASNDFIFFYGDVDNRGSTLNSNNTQSKNNKSTRK